MGSRWCIEIWEHGAESMGQRAKAENGKNQRTGDGERAEVESPRTEVSEGQRAEDPGEMDFGFPGAGTDGHGYAYS